jgi:universal stress protein A
MSSFKRILAPTDFSEHAHRALERAIALARDAGAELHICHAIHYVAPIVSPYEIPIPDDFIQQTRESAQLRLDEQVANATKAGVDCKGHLLSDAPDPAISNLAEELGIDLIVMGTRGHTGLKHVLLGSVAERTVRHAHCSVLTVKKGPDED